MSTVPSWRAPQRAPLPLVLALAVTVVALLGGAGVYLVAGRPDTLSVFGGEPSVQELDLPGAADGVKVGVAAVGPVEPNDPAREPATARDAIDGFLRAEREGRFRESHALLTEDGKRRFTSVASWERDSVDRLLPLSTTVSPDPRGTRSAGREVFQVEATHRPSLDRFRGLVPARSVSFWDVRNESGRWRVAPRPAEVEPVVPPNTTASGVVRQWLAARAACDARAAAALEATNPLVDDTDLRELPCRMKQPGVASDAVAASRAGSLASFLAAFGSSTPSWATAVPVELSGNRFFVLLAPLDDWRVMGLVPAEQKERPPA